MIISKIDERIVTQVPSHPIQRLDEEKVQQDCSNAKLQGYFDMCVTADH